MAQEQQPSWHPGVLAALGVGSAVGAVIADRAGIGVQWWGVPIFAVLVGAIALFWTVGGDQGWRVLIYRLVGVGAAGVWVTVTTKIGWSRWTIGALVLIVLALAALRVFAYPPASAAPVSPATWPTQLEQQRPELVVRYEHLIRHLTGSPTISVTDIRPWTNPDDGERVFIELPADGKVTEDQLQAICPNVAIAMRLPRGCTARIVRLPGAHQGLLAMDVQLRVPTGIQLRVDLSPTSVYEPFPVMTATNGERLQICLRKQSMVIGGAPDAGKTTLLHWLIRQLARCIDAIICVADTNGGGVAEPWMRPYALGKISTSILGWVAPDDAEAVVMTYVINAIVKDRKSSPEAIRRRHGTNDTLLPVDATLPAIIVLNDEGGELRQAVGLLGQLADQYLSRLAEIGRAEGGRIVKSVLRGTADLLDKALRVCAAIRICLRMEEPDEMDHVLGRDPGKAELTRPGEGFLRTPDIPRPVLGRTGNITLQEIEQAAIACASLRPDFDERAYQVAARVRVRDILGGRDPDPQIMKLRVMRDVEAGRALTGRWERYERYLAAQRGEELPEDDPEDEAESGPPALAPDVAALVTAVGGASAALSGSVSPPATPPAEPAPPVELDDATVKAKFEQIAANTSPIRVTTREHILDVLAGGPLTSGQIGAALDARRAGVARQTRQALLRELVRQGVLEQDGERAPYRLAARAGAEQK
jgi:hypothetical protein